MSSLSRQLRSRVLDEAPTSQQHAAAAPVVASDRALDESAVARYAAALDPDARSEFLAGIALAVGKKRRGEAL